MNQDAPQPPPPLVDNRFQFSIGAMFASTLAAAVVMAVMRGFFQFDPAPMRGGAGARLDVAYAIVNWVGATVAIALLLYTMLRLPYLFAYLGRRRRHWLALRNYRRELLDWTARRKPKTED